jgi:hypothetical protein
MHRGRLVWAYRALEREAPLVLQLLRQIVRMLAKHNPTRQGTAQTFLLQVSISMDSTSRKDLQGRNLCYIEDDRHGHGMAVIRLASVYTSGYEFVNWTF